MLTRIATYEGTIKPGHEEEFFSRVTAELEPMWRQFPHVSAVRVLRAIKADPDARPVAMILEMDFPSMDAIDEAMTSAILPRAHQATLDVMKLFDGRFYHVIMQSRTI